MRPGVSGDIDIAISWLYAVVYGNLERHATARGLIRDALNQAKDAHNSPSSDDFTEEQEPTIDILARCLECWDEYARNETEGNWEDASSDPIQAVISTKGSMSKDGSIRWWIRAVGDQAQKLCDSGTRGALIPIQIEVVEGIYAGTLRYSKTGKSAQINPEVKNTDGDHALSRILTDSGIQADRPVELIKLGNRIRVRQHK